MPGILTTQISVLVFEDHFSINNAPELPNEGSLEGFSIVLFEAGGEVMIDVFGNMFGTTDTTDVDDSLSVDMPGAGAIRSDVNGEAYIRNPAPGKYGLQVIPSPSTLEPSSPSTGSRPPPTRIQRPLTPGARPTRRRPSSKGSAPASNMPPSASSSALPRLN